MAKKNQETFVTVKGQAASLKGVKLNPNGLQPFFEEPRFAKSDYDKMAGLVDSGCLVHITITQAEAPLPGFEDEDDDGQQTFD